MAERADPIGYETFIVDPETGQPSAFFIQQWNSVINVGLYAFNDITAGAGLSGGGALADGEVTLSLETLSPSPAGDYGSATEVPIITVDEFGRVTVASETTITATVAVEDDGVVFGDFNIFNFVGTEWTLTDAGGGQLDIEVSGGGSSITVEDEGTPLTTAVTLFDFAGAGVTVSEPVADQVLVTIPGETFTALDVEDEGTSVGNATIMDFVGAGVTATFSGGRATITIPGGGGGGGGGGGTGSAARGVRLTLNATESLVAFTDYIIPWDVEDFDDDGFADLGTNPTRITVPTGVTRMSFNGGCQLGSTSGTDQILLAIIKNGTDTMARTRHSSDGSRFAGIGTGILDVVAGDYFELQVQSSDAATVQNTDATFFSGQVEETADMPVQDDGVEIVAAPSAFNFTGAGVTVTDNGGVADIDIPGGGNVQVSGTVANDSVAVSGSAFAFKGNVVDPDIDTYVHYLAACLDTIVAGEYNMCIAEINGSNVIQSITFSTARTPGAIRNAEENEMGFKFDPPVLMEAGKTYAFMIGCTNQGNTYALPCIFPGASNHATFPIPGQTQIGGFARIADQAPAVGDTVDRGTGIVRMTGSFSY